MASYETLRGQVLGSGCGGTPSRGWALLVRQGLAVWLRTLSRLDPSPLPVSSTTSVWASPRVQQEITNLLIAMVWIHYQKELQ